jgi:hypothetical protein
VLRNSTDSPEGVAPLSPSDRHDNQNPEILLVIRHGKRGQDLADVAAVARRLDETIPDLPFTIQRWAICHANTAPTATTAVIFKARLPALGEPEEISCTKLRLGPPQFPSYSLPDNAIENRVTELWGEVDCLFSPGQEGCLPGNPLDMLVLVGHQPAIDWFLDGRVDEDVAVALGEVAALIRRRGTRGRWHLWWVITPESQNALSGLREKIQSKMTVLAVLAGFSTAVLAATAIELAGNAVARPETRLLMLAAIALFFASAVVQIGTLLAYDRLMMPHRFWRTRQPRASRSPGELPTGVVERPPSSAGWVVYQESVRLWRWAVNAFIVAGAGVLVLLAAVACNDLESVVVAGVAAIIVLLALICRRELPPDTGAPD